MNLFFVIENINACFGQANRVLKKSFDPNNLFRDDHITTWFIAITQEYTQNLIKHMISMFLNLSRAYFQDKLISNYIFSFL